jgi:hypothetical protein
VQLLLRHVMSALAQLTDELLDLTVVAKGYRNALFAFQDNLGCCSCTCCCGAAG